MRARNLQLDTYAGSDVSRTIYGERPAYFESHVCINENVTDAWAIPALHIELKNGPAS